MKNTSKEGSDYHRLRELLVGSELEQIHNLRKHFDNPEQFTGDVSQVLPQAIAKSLNKDQQMVESLAPAIDGIFDHLINRDIDKFAKALFPVIGPAIRKSIAESFKQMIQTLNKTIELSFTWQGIKWRIESLRTGMPIAQIAMLHGLVYRVEQVFLIHRETGLLLQHIHQEDIDYKNADIISSMLTAIGDFVGDSFNQSTDETLDRIEMGELSIWVERGPEALIAIAVRGEAPKLHRAKMSSTLEKIHQQFSQHLLDFNGNTSIFEPCQFYLRQCLDVQYKEEKKSTSIVSLTVWTVLICLLIFWLVTSIHARTLRSDYVALLEQEPGYVITKSASQDGVFVIYGLRDPLSSSFDQLLSQSELDPKSVSHQFSPYQSLDSEFIIKRISKTIRPPNNVTLSLNQGVLAVSGFATSDWITQLNQRMLYFTSVDYIDTDSLKDKIDLSGLEAPETVNFEVDVNNGLVKAIGYASKQWIEQSNHKSKTIDGVQNFDASNLLVAFDTNQLDPPESVSLTWHNGLLTIEGEATQDWIASLSNVTSDFPEITSIDKKSLINSTEVSLEAQSHLLEEIIILFDSSLSFNLKDESQLDQAELLIVDIVNKAKSLSREIMITVRGYSDSVGSFEDNQFLSLERADFVTQKIYLSGISPKVISLKGIEKPVEIEKNLEEQAYNRRVEFNVSFLNPK